MANYHLNRFYIFKTTLSEKIEDYLQFLTHAGEFTFMALNDADVDIKTKNSRSNSGYNETMQNVLASIIPFFK